MSFFSDIFALDFLSLAFIATLLVSFVTGLFSTVVVLRKIEFIGDGVAHAAFGGLALGFLIGVNTRLIAILTAIIFAVVINLFSKKGYLSENSMIGILLPLSMALGIIFLSFVEGYTPDVMSYLFGNILLVSVADIWILAVIAIVSGISFLLFHREILYYSFDETLARHSGINVPLVNFFVLIGVSVSIVASVKIAGIILVTAFLVTPAVIAKRLAKTFKGIVFTAITFSLLSSILGLWGAYEFEISPGPSIVVVLFITFVTVYLITLKRKDIQ